MSNQYKYFIGPKGVICSDKVTVFRIPNTVPVDNSPLIVYSSSKNLPLDFKRSSQIQGFNSFEEEEVVPEQINKSLNQNVENYTYRDDLNYTNVFTDDKYYYNNEQAGNHIIPRDSYYTDHNKDSNVGISENAGVACYDDIPKIRHKEMHVPLNIRNNIPRHYKNDNEDDLYNSNDYFQEDSYNFVPYSSKPAEEFYNSGISGNTKSRYTPGLPQKTQYYGKAIEQKELFNKNVLYKRYSNHTSDPTHRSTNLSSPKKGTYPLYDKEDNGNELSYTTANQINSKSALHSRHDCFNAHKEFDNNINNELREQGYDPLYVSQAMENKNVNNSFVSSRAGLLYDPKYSYKALKDGSNIETSNKIVDTKQRDHINVNKTRSWYYKQNKNDSPLYGSDRHYKLDISGSNNELNIFKTVVDNLTSNTSSNKTSLNFLNTKPQYPQLRSKSINITNNNTRYNLSPSDNDPCPLNSAQNRFDDCLNKESAISRPVNLKKSDHNNVPCKKTKSVTFKL